MRDEKRTIIPFYKAYTPRDIGRDAEFTTFNYTITPTTLTFGADSTDAKRLFKLPLLKKNVLYADSDITVVLTIGLDSGIRRPDSDPKFFLSDGSNGIGYQMRDETAAVRCQGIEAIMGPAYTSIKPFPGPSHDSDILPEQFVLTIKPSQQWGSCYTAIDSGIISPVAYTRSVDLDEGLWLEVYRENLSEQYTFNYIQVEIHEN